ncbi:MAG: primosomal protein N' [Patescibacteria group bacterium]
MFFAEILFPQKVGLGKETLTYSVPENLDLKPGHLVKVNLRRKELTGLVLEIHQNKPEFKTIPILAIENSQPLLTQEQLALLGWMSEYYFCPLHKILKLFIPKRVFNNKKITKNSAKNTDQIIKTGTKKLTQQQDDIAKSIRAQTLNKFLIHGITGSGKTEVYAQLAEEYINQDKQVLILVPEISLTPQIIDYFQKALGHKAAVIHSRVAEGNKQLTWMQIHEGKTKLIIGSRSAIFAPFQNLGLIVVDEEHENSYKQDNAPRYNVHQIIDKLLELNPKLKVVFGSATPSIETVEKLKDSTLMLSERINGSTLPLVEIIDLRDEFKKGNYSMFSDSLKEALLEVLFKKEQAILFLNRRGSASSIVCRDCGFTVKCTNCETPITYHSSKTSAPKLICHHCGKIYKVPTTCPNCQGSHIRFLGIGTEKIETELLKEFPGIRVFRADKDTTGGKEDFENIYKKFKNQEADVLIGTQMIAKGLHLPKVSLVGVVLADIGLNIPDFRSTERNFQLLTQVAGRAGRGDSKGRVVIQTYNPDNIALQAAQTHNYEKFFKYESVQRKILKNPPFSKLAKILIEHKSLKTLQELTIKLESILKNSITEPEKELIEINSYPAYLTKLRGKYRHIILLKYITSSPTVFNPLHSLLSKLPKEYIIDPGVKIDLDPTTVT